MNEQYTLWTNVRLYTPDQVFENGRLLVSLEGRIEAVGGPELNAENAVVQDGSGLIMLPGFIDVHVHGGMGVGVMDGTYESLNTMSLFHAAYGTTSLLATTTTSPDDRIVRALQNAAETMKKGVSGAEIIGIHLEGPFLSVKRRGAQSKEDIKLPTKEQIHRYFEASDRQMRLVTVAPEVEGGLDAVREFAALGVTVSCGHSDATLAEVREAVRAGVSHTTHHFNGMSPLHHREPGVAGAGMMLPEITTEIIADGIHVHPDLIKLLFEVKSPRGVCMITDAVNCAGLPDGEYGGSVMKNGQIMLKDGSTLAGSSLTTIQALRNVIAFTGLKIEDILPSLTEVPARQAKVDDRKGSLVRGKDADFILVDEQLNLEATFVKGKQVYKRTTGGVHS